MKHDAAPLGEASGDPPVFTLLVPHAKWDDRVDSGVEAFAATGKCRSIYARGAGI
jgi:hypothetical protein